jgi:hypothetical protein
MDFTCSEQNRRIKELVWPPSNRGAQSPVQTHWNFLDGEMHRNAFQLEIYTKCRFFMYQGPAGVSWLFQGGMKA